MQPPVSAECDRDQIDCYGSRGTFPDALVLCFWGHSYVEKYFYSACQPYSDTFFETIALNPAVGNILCPRAVATLTVARVCGSLASVLSRTFNFQKSISRCAPVFYLSKVMSTSHKPDTISIISSHLLLVSAPSSRATMNPTRTAIPISRRE